MMHPYVYEKLREIDAELLAGVPHAAPPSRRRSPVFGPVLRAAGRALRNVGEGLESCGSSPSVQQEPEGNTFRLDQPSG